MLIYTRIFAFGIARMYDKGHEIVGVEIAELAIKEFFEESNLPYVEEDVPDVKGKLLKVHVYCIYFFSSVMVAV